MPLPLPPPALPALGVVAVAESVRRTRLLRTPKRATGRDVATAVVAVLVAAFVAVARQMERSSNVVVSPRGLGSRNAPTVEELLRGRAKIGAVLAGIAQKGNTDKAQSLVWLLNETLAHAYWMHGDAGVRYYAALDGAMWTGTAWERRDAEGLVRPLNKSDVVEYLVWMEGATGAMYLVSFLVVTGLTSHEASPAMWVTLCTLLAIAVLELVVKTSQTDLRSNSQWTPFPMRFAPFEQGEMVRVVGACVVALELVLARAFFFHDKIAEYLGMLVKMNLLQGGVVAAGSSFIGKSLPPRDPAEIERDIAAAARAQASSEVAQAQPSQADPAAAAHHATTPPTTTTTPPPSSSPSKKKQR